MARGTGWRGGLLAAVTAVTLGGAAAAVVTLDEDAPSVAVAPAPSPSAAPVRGVLLGGARGAEAAPTTAGLQAAVGQVLADPAIAGRLAVSIVDGVDGRPLFEQGAGTPLLPASTVKIATAAAALTALPPDRRLSTQVVSGAVPGEVVLVGGGDPTLSGPGGERDYPASASLAELAAKVRVSLGAAPVTRVVVDESLYSGERVGPGWKPTYLSQGAVAAVGPLMVDGGRVSPDRSPRHADPALAAGRQLATLLAASTPPPAAGDPGAGGPGAAPAPAPPPARKPGPVDVTRGSAPAAPTLLGEVFSPTIVALVERMLARSDNDLAEALARHVALAQGQPASFAGASVALEQVLAPLGVDPATAVLADGSGLSRSNRIPPSAVTGLLARATSGSNPRLAPLLTGLPVGGFSGTLAGRYRTGTVAAPGAGAVRAKTGTLEGVSALAGVVRTNDGRLLAFDLVADGVPAGANAGAEKALDRLASSLAACGCR